MALSTRVGRLERTARSRVGAGTPCPHCHAPAGTVPGVRLETAEGEPVGRRCVCGFWVDDHGRAVCPVGSGGVKVYGFDGLTQV